MTLDNGIPEQHDRDLEGEISEEFLHSQPSPEPSHHSHTDSPQLPEPERPRDQPSQGPEQPVPWDLLFPRRSTFRDAIVSNALPPLLDLLRDPSNRLKSPRDLVNEALDKCKSNGRVFWGANDVYSRKRSAVDAILAHYFFSFYRTMRQVDQLLPFKRECPISKASTNSSTESDLSRKSVF